MLALILAWCLVVSSRNVWTPDEPRELALSASQVDHFTSLPSLGGTPFAEKPPLAYWVSGASMREWGVSGAAARAPLVIYALIAFAAIFLLGRRLGTVATGVAAALIFSTSWLVFDAQVWLASDALLLMAVTVALLGIYTALGDPGTGRDFRVGCACMHLGLLVALFTKNFAGWLVPVSTLFAYLLVERRLRRLLHPALWLPALGSLGLLWFWAQRVAASPGGAAQVHALFWDNLAGRLGSFFDSSQSVRALGHRNWPGKYLVELPLYLLPWTPLVVGAAIRLWRARRATSSAMRFALCAFVPGLVILSCAATSRGIYAAPLMPGISLLVAIALTSPESDPAMDGLVRASFRGTTWLVLILDGGMLAGIATLQLIRGIDDPTRLVVAVVGFLIVAKVCRSLLRTLGDPRDSPLRAEAAIGRLAGAHVAALIALALALFPLLNRSQDLARIAAFIDEVSGGRPLVLWLPDETTLAMSDLYLRKPVCTILFNTETAEQRVRHLARCLQEFPDAAIVGMLICPPSECDRTTGLTTPADPLQRRHLEFGDAALTEAGVLPVEAIVRPEGRAYLVGFRAP